MRERDRGSHGNETDRYERASSEVLVAGMRLLMLLFCLLVWLGALMALNAWFGFW